MVGNDNVLFRVCFFCLLVVFFVGTCTDDTYISWRGVFAAGPCENKITEFRDNKGRRGRDCRDSAGGAAMCSF